MLNTFSARVTEDSLVTGTRTTNYDISHIAFVNAILLLLSASLPSIQRSIWIIERGDITSQKSVSFWTRSCQRKIKGQCGYFFIHWWISEWILDQKNRNRMQSSLLYSPKFSVAREACKREKIIRRREIGTIIRQIWLEVVGIFSKKTRRPSTMPSKLLATTLRYYAETYDEAFFPKGVWWRNDAKGVLFLYQMHRISSTKVSLLLSANETIADTCVVWMGYSMWLM